MVRPVDFDDEPATGSQEVDDEAPERHLATKPDTEATAAELGPEPLLGIGEQAAVLASTKLNEGR